MSEAERRIGYSPSRILITAERILDPEFHPQGIYLTGSQVELLRNITGYLNMRATFVDVYHGMYYLMPDDEDWDAIQKIVADMEEKLSNNDNVPWGFNDGFVRDLATTAEADGQVYIVADEVPAGEILVLQGLSWANKTGSRGAMEFRLTRDAIKLDLAYIAAPSVNAPLLWAGAITLEENDKIFVRQYSALENDVYVGAAWGYRMLVPG